MKDEMTWDEFFEYMDDVKRVFNMVYALWSLGVTCRYNDIQHSQTSICEMRERLIRRNYG